MNETAFVENIMAKSKTPLQDAAKKSPVNEALNEIKVKSEKRAARER